MAENEVATCRVETASGRPLSRRDVLRGAGAVIAGAGLAATVGLPSAEASAARVTRRGRKAAKRTIVWWEDFAGSKQNARLALVADFQKAHPEITVQQQTVFSPNDLDAKALTAMSSGVVPDLITNEWFYNTAYAFEGRLLALDNYMKHSHVQPANLDHAALATGVVNGSTYCIPNYTNDLVLAYNKSIAQQSGLDPNAPPKNWDELQQWSIAMTQRNGSTVTRAGFFYEDTSFYFTNEFALFLWGAGGDFFSKDGKHVIFNNDAGVKALTFMRNLITRYDVATPLFGQGAQGAQTPLYNGTEAMTIGFPPTVVNAKPYNIDLGLAPFPKMNGGAITTIDPFTTCIPKASKNPEDAWLFIDFMLRRNEQVKFALPTNNIPALKSAQAAAIEANPVIKTFAGILPHAKPLPVIAQYAAMQPIISQMVQNVYFNREAPKAALDEAASAVKALISG